MSATHCRPPESSAHARDRRARLCNHLAHCNLDGAFITDARDIAYFIGGAIGTPSFVPACLFVSTSGESLLTCGVSDIHHNVDQTSTYAWHDGGTISADLTSRMIAAPAFAFRRHGTRFGVQTESMNGSLLAAINPGEPVSIDHAVRQVQRTKDAHDLFGLCRAIESNLAAFEMASALVTPGANELEVFAAGARGAMLHAGEKIEHDGDYRCGAPGGVCRNRAIETGELYIIDAWTRRSGYWSDLAKVFPVGGANDAQSELIDHVQSVHAEIRPMLKPGVSGGAIWSAMDAALRKLPALNTSGLIHHGGHGIGVRLHEAPDINPGVTDTLQAGDVICIEPGGYTDAGNVRIEETYLVTATGPVCLSSSDHA